MLTATVSETRIVALETLKHTWKITSPQDVVGMADKTFVRVTRLSSSLCSLVTEANQMAPHPLPKSWSFTTSEGFRIVMEIQNTEQAKSMAESVEGCTLFEKPVKVRRLGARPSKERMRNYPTI